MTKREKDLRAREAAVVAREAAVVAREAAVAIREQLAPRGPFPVQQPSPWRQPYTPGSPWPPRPIYDGSPTVTCSDGVADEIDARRAMFMGPIRDHIHPVSHVTD